MSESREWFHKTLLHNPGPLTLSELRERATLGQLKPIDLVRCGSEGEWIKANRVPALYASFGTWIHPIADTQADQSDRQGPPTIREMVWIVLDHLRHPKKLGRGWTQAREFVSSAIRETFATYLPGLDDTYEVRGEDHEVRVQTLREIRQLILDGRLQPTTAVRKVGAVSPSHLAEWRPISKSLACEVFPIAVLYRPIAAHASLGMVVYGIFPSSATVAVNVLGPFGPAGIFMPIVAALPLAYDWHGTIDLIRRQMFGPSRLVGKILTWLGIVPLLLVAAGQVGAWAVVITAFLLLFVIFGGLLAGLVSLFGDDSPLVGLLAWVILVPAGFTFIPVISSLVLGVGMILLMGAVVGGVVGLLRAPFLPKSPVPLPRPTSG